MRWRVAGETEPTCSWEYDEGRDRLLSIYEKGKTKQWNAATLILFLFFFSSRRRHTRCLSYWSSDVCSSDLISFVTTPLVVSRENVYVAFVTDQTLSALAASFEWSVTENGGTPQVQTTDHGEFSYTPAAAGRVGLVVRILDESKAEQAKLSL